MTTCRLLSVPLVQSPELTIVAHCRWQVNGSPPTDEQVSKKRPKTTKWKIGLNESIGS